jgi:hypothetical protein
MRGRRAGILREIKADCDITERSDRQVDWIADDNHPRRHRDRLATAEGQGAIRAGDDARVLVSRRDVGRANLDRCAIERVGQLHPRPTSADARAEDHPNRLIRERLHRR